MCSDLLTTQKDIHGIVDLKGGNFCKFAVSSTRGDRTKLLLATRLEDLSLHLELVLILLNCERKQTPTLEEMCTATLEGNLVVQSFLVFYVLYSFHDLIFVSVVLFSDFIVYMYVGL